MNVDPGREPGSEVEAHNEPYLALWLESFALVDKQEQISIFFISLNLFLIPSNMQCGQSDCLFWSVG